MGGCSTTTGELDTSQFSKPVIVIGLYIASASLGCGLLMLTDVVRGFRQRKLWLPCKYFPLNAVTLTILGIAIKIPGDLNNPMPGRLDQLSKHSGTALICVVVAFTYPSLGPMDGGELFSNVSAIVILVVTIIVDLSIQMSTGVIYTFFPEHIILMVVMFVELAYTVSTALAVPAAKLDLHEQFEKKKQQQQQQQQQQMSSDDHQSNIAEFEKRVEKYWLMAYCGSPQHVVGRLRVSSIICAASFVASAVLVEAVVRSFSFRSLKFCEGSSDYRWTIWSVVISQLLVVLFGTCAVTYRVLNVKTFSNLKGVEEYCLHQLKKFRQEYLSFRQIRGLSKVHWLWQYRFLYPLYILEVFWHRFIISLLSGVIFLQALMVRIKETIYGYFSNLHMRLFNTSSNDVDIDALNDLDDFVLQLKGEEMCTKSLNVCWQREIKEIRDVAQRNSPKLLLPEILCHCGPPRRGYRRLAMYVGQSESLMSNNVRGGSDFQDCWTLVIATLSSIAVTLGDTGGAQVESFLKAIDEGLKYVRFIEEKLDKREQQVHVREAAALVWFELVVNNKWLGISLEQSGNGRRVHNAVEMLMRSSEEIMAKIEKETNQNTGSSTRTELLERNIAARSMHRICKNIMQENSMIHKLPNNKSIMLLRWIQRTVADIMAACLINLPTAVAMESSSMNATVGEERIRHALTLLYETESFLQGLRSSEARYPEKIEHIDEWLRFHKLTRKVKLRVPDAVNHQRLSDFLSNICDPPQTSSQEKVFFDRLGMELSSQQAILRLIFYDNDNSNSRCVLSLKPRSWVVGCIEDDEEDVEPSLARACIANPHHLASLLPSSRIMRRLEREYGNVVDGYVHLGGFKNVRTRYKRPNEELILEVDVTQYEFGTTYRIRCDMTKELMSKELLQNFLGRFDISVNYSEASKLDVFYAGQLLP